MACIDWSNIMMYTNYELSIIKMKLNTTFDSILTDLDKLSIESQKYIQLRLQDHVVSIADQQRKIARMHRQLSAANEILIQRHSIEYNYKKIIGMILFGLIIGMTYERFIRPRFPRGTI